MVGNGEATMYFWLFEGFQDQPGRSLGVEEFLSEVV